MVPERSRSEAEPAPGQPWQIVGLGLAPVTAVLVWTAPLALSDPAHRLAAVLAAVVVLWVTEAIPMAITAFLGVAATVVLGVAPASEAFAPFADPLIFLFIGTFMLAQAIFFHGLDRRFAFAILALGSVAERPGLLLAAFAAVTASISMWISNTATVAMMYPIGLSLLAVLDEQGATRRLSARYATALLLSTSFAASVGGLATPVGTPPNLIGIGFVRREIGVELPFFTWMALGIPVVLMLFGWLVVVLGRAGRVARIRLVGVGSLVAVERARLGPWTRGQINTVVAFGLTVCLWVLPGITALVLGERHPACAAFHAVLPEGVVALLGATLLFVLPTDVRRGRFTLPWEEAVKIDWWIVFLYGGGIALGTLAFKTGLADAIGRGLTGLLGVRSELGLLALSTALATVLSETTSNTASANMVVPVVIALARSAGIDPVVPAVGATMGASLGFLLPVSTPCNAIVYGAGRIPLSAMMRNGILLDVAGVIVIVAVVGTLGPWLLASGPPAARH
jgi:sodium-dependent dicarboxylate transporter 2/3/5